ncbi:MAG TPA: SDR family NAD(P)-dependent oxidoreductase [Gaiellaceae bacterium]|nr:SDR family NAD(P)-dependent oxidoreductase [Gaiellaceae bacterium]
MGGPRRRHRGRRPHDARGQPRGGRAALDLFGRLDAVVPNAGFQHVAPVAQFAEERWEALVAVLLTSPFLLAKYASEALAASGEGRFVAIASVHGLVASPFKTGYVVAKHGLLGLVKVLALEGAERGITASAVCPAFTRTPLVEAQIADQARAHGLPEGRVLEEVILARTPSSGRSSQRRVGAVVAFLLGPERPCVLRLPVTMDLCWTAR